MSSEHHPPKLFHRLFRWYCDPAIADYIEGDLMEVYIRRVKKNGKKRADLRFIIDVILLFRPGIIKSQELHQPTTTTGMFKSYFKIGWRNLYRNKAYAFINVVGLGLSMTCGIFIFSLINNNLSFDNFHPDSDRVYRVVTELHRDGIAYRSNVPAPLGETFRNDYTHAEKIARIYTEYNSLVTVRKDNELLKFNEDQTLAFAEPTYLEMFGFPIVEGNRKNPLVEPNTAAITERIAKKYFGEKSAVGETFWLDNKLAVTVTAILKDIPINTDLRSEILISWASLKLHDKWLFHETAGWGGIRDGMKCYILLRPGIPTTQVEEAMSAYVKVFRPTSKNVHHYKLQPLNDVHFNASYGGPMQKSNLWVLGIIGAFLVITACVNFINLATAQALQRSKEVGIKKALGSLKTQLFWQFIFETGMITFMGVAIAAVVSYLITPYVNGYLNTQIPVDLFTNPSLLIFIAALGIVVTVVAGYYPGIVLARFQPVAALKGRFSQQNIGGFNIRRALIVSQFAISQVLIIGVVVIMNQVKFATQSDLGFDKEAIVMVEMGQDSTGMVPEAMKNEILNMRGVEMVSSCFTAPASEDDWGNSIKLDNSTEEVNFRTSMKLADADYVSTFGLEIVAGHNLAPADTVRETLINETMVRKLNFSSPDEALGHTITADGGEMKARIVGVVKDFHDKSFHEQIAPIMITTLSEDYTNYAVKLKMADASAVLEAIEDKWLQHHPDQLFKYEFLDESIERFYNAEQTTLKLIQTFSFIAIFIGCLGLYGLVSFMVNQKTREVGIRKVLGGTAAHITWIFGKEFARLIIIAFVIAAPIGWYVMSDWLKNYEFQIQISVWTFVFAIGCSIVVAAVTVSYKVISAALRNPVNSLRTE
jgi:putative ABC transport system permease protein